MLKRFAVILAGITAVVPMLAQNATLPAKPTVRVMPNIPDWIPAPVSRPGIDAINLQPDSPAPALTQVLLNYVCYGANGSTCYNVLNDYSISGHGSASQVIVFSIGYGYTPVVTLAGYQLPASDEIANNPLCAVSGGYSSNCTPPFVVQGYRTVWNISNIGSPLGTGYFVFTQQNESSPYNTISKQIEIYP